MFRDAMPNGKRERVAVVHKTLYSTQKTTGTDLQCNPEK